MRWILTDCERLVTSPDLQDEPEPGKKRFRVSCAAVCRTDAKLWKEGHRDLVLPRVPGHEMVVLDEKKGRFAVWPGNRCGGCKFCQNHQDTLCDKMEISGFHQDGGFSDFVDLNPENLIPVPEGLSSPLACFAEPLGCAIHALAKMNLKAQASLLVMGGGPLGMMIAWAALFTGLRPIVIEKNEQKIRRIAPFLEHTGISCGQRSPAIDFDAVITACSDPSAFHEGLTRIEKGGCFSFFSGLGKTPSLSTDFINLIHYKELTLTGSYGCAKRDMERAIELIARDPQAVSYLVESSSGPDRLPEILETVIKGDSLKHIIDFNLHKEKKTMTEQTLPFIAPPENGNDLKTIKARSEIARVTVGRLEAVGQSLFPNARKKMDFKTKPLGALGKLEDAAIQMSLIQEDLNPRIDRKNIFVFAGDHGVAAEGVSAFPSEVTAQMVLNFLNGGAAINVLCRHHGIDIHVVDMGVQKELPPHKDLISKKIGKGTKNFAHGPAMSLEEAIQGIENGMSVFLAEWEKSPIHIVGLGEMGIANTTSATAIICALTGIAPREATGRGTGIDDKSWGHKVKVIEKALDFHQACGKSGLDILTRLGGFEIAGIVGAILAAASKKTAVVLDGVISTAAGLIAWIIAPEIRGYLFSGHRSVEIAQKSALERMGLSPLVDLDMRLGEGTGAALAIDIIDAACRIMREMASFEEAGVSNNK
jgi:nicotinate-nucleotide--dimethylbenzimidazole phosphoribosyltransferase